jgi:carbonic anhydrase
VGKSGPLALAHEETFGVIMSESLLKQLLEVNRSFLNGSAKSLASEGESFIVFSCIDPRLTGLLEPALGLPRHRAILIRTAGNILSDRCPDVKRSLAAGLYLKNAKEIFVIGHTDCVMARFSAQDVIESFRSAGVSRSAFGNEDLRAWFGAFSDVRANVLQGIEFLRKSGLVAEAVNVHGLIIDSNSGAAEIVFDGSAPRAPQRETPAEPAGVHSGPPARPATAPSGAAIDNQSPRREMTIEEIVKSFRRLYAMERQNRQFQLAMAELALVLKKERDAGRILSALEKAVAPFFEKYPECRGTIEALKKIYETRGPGGLNWIELARQMFQAR